MLNSIVIIGRLTAAPEKRVTNNGTAVVSFSIAVDRNIKTKDGETQTDFIPVVAWRHTAEFICKYFSKGDMLALRGELQSRRYTGNDGKNHTILEVLAQQVSFCGGHRKAENDTEDFSSTSQDKDYPEIDDEDLQF